MSILNRTKLGIVISALLLAPMVGKADQNSDISSMASSLDTISKNTDIKRSELAWALINYEASARANEYQLNKELLFMQSPSIAWALVAAQEISANSLALDSFNFGMQGYLSILQSCMNPPSTGSVQFHLATAQPPAINLANLPNASGAVTGSSFFNLVGGFVSAGDVSAAGGFNNINPVGLLLQTNWAESGYTPQQIVQLISLITNPLPTPDSDITAALQWMQQNPNAISNTKCSTAPTPLCDYGSAGTAVDKITNFLAQSAASGLTSAALGDLAARRNPNLQTIPSSSGQMMSVMDVMSQQSGVRFTSPIWYTALSASSEAAILREIAQIQAFSVWMQYEQFRVQEQEMAMIAALNGNIARLTNAIASLTSSVQNIPHS